MNDLKFTTASDYMNTDTKFDDLMYRAGLTAQGCWDEMDEYDRNAIQKFAELIVRECIEINKQELAFNAFERLMNKYQEHFTVEEPKGWICPKCNADRTKIACPLGFGATVDGRCPMTVEAQ